MFNPFSPVSGLNNLAMTGQPLELESCSNPVQIRQVF